MSKFAEDFYDPGSVLDEAINSAGHYENETLFRIRADCSSSDTNLIFSGICLFESQIESGLIGLIP